MSDEQAPPPPPTAAAPVVWTDDLRRQWVAGAARIALGQRGLTPERLLVSRHKLTGDDMAKAGFPGQLREAAWYAWAACEPIARYWLVLVEGDPDTAPTPRLPVRAFTTNTVPEGELFVPPPAAEAS